MGVSDKFSGFVVGLDALSKGLGGVGVNAQAVTARITALYQGFVGLSVVTNTTGKEMDALAFRTLQIAKQMGYTQESVIAMQKTLMVGFQKPIHDVDTFNNLLARSEQLFGRNEESASRLIDTLARQSKEMSSLRDLTLEISNIEGRAFKEKRQLNAEELKTTGAAREASEATLKAKFEAGEINAEQFSTSMSMHRREKDIQGEILVVSQFTLHAATKKGNRPSYIKASKVDIAIPLYEKFLAKITLDLEKDIQTGVFGADMKVSLVNDGPVTIIIDSKNKE